MYAKIYGVDPKMIVQKLQQLDENGQQQAIQTMVAEVQQGARQMQQPQMQEPQQQETMPQISREQAIEELKARGLLKTDAQSPDNSALFAENPQETIYRPKNQQDFGLVPSGGLYVDPVTGQAARK
jgi:uncharacterized protein involved in exopolysaccharide biosynthesis